MKEENEMHKKLFIPGPTEVRPKMLQHLATPMIGHRSKEFSALLGEVTSKVQKLLYTKDHVFMSTSSSTGVMEGVVRNLVEKKVLACYCGAFSERWAEIAEVNGKETDRLEVEWGKAILPEMVDEKLKKGGHETVMIVHNETSTGVMNPIAEVAQMMREKYPDVLLAVDAVSSMAGVKIDVDGWGLDVCLAGLQKAFALPPGLAVFSVSDRALEKARTVTHRGYYFDFLVFLKYWDKLQTPTTPSIPHLFALNKQMDDMLAEGLEARFKRHEKMAKIARDWGKKHFALFAQPGYESVTLTTYVNTRGISVAGLNEQLAKRGAVISNGYGKTKEKAFRIAHMGDTTVDELTELLGWIDEILELD
jgi:aspartate aminotransferase-like enzyme